MANVFDVAAYLLSKADVKEGDGLTHLKLQKLVYYAQGFALVLLKKPLFPETIEAWTHGPVVPDLYHHYKDRVNRIILKSTKGDIENLAPEEKELLDDVFEVYGQYSAIKLRNLTHNEPPWQFAENKRDKTISTESMKKFFLTLVE